jgi:hypothetical protein
MQVDQHYGYLLISNYKIFLTSSLLPCKFQSRQQTVMVSKNYVLHIRLKLIYWLPLLYCFELASVIKTRTWIIEIIFILLQQYEFLCLVIGNTHINHLTLTQVDRNTIHKQYKTYLYYICTHEHKAMMLNFTKVSFKFSLAFKNYAANGFHCRIYMLNMIAILS